MAKLFLFDLGTLDGIFRVVVFIVVGLVLLGMGAGYARLLERQDQQQDQAGVTGSHTLIWTHSRLWGVDLAWAPQHVAQKQKYTDFRHRPS